MYSFESVFLYLRKVKSNCLSLLKVNVHHYFFYIILWTLLQKFHGRCKQSLTWTFATGHQTYAFAMKFL